jgi:two-component system NtrC family sensor kinase
MNELERLRARVAELEEREKQLQQAEVSLARLTTFPEQNPNPVIEIDLEVTYLNPAARGQFPDLVERGREHPVLAGFDAILGMLERVKEPTVQAELSIEGRTYEQKTTFMEQTELVRVFFRISVS